MLEAFAWPPSAFILILLGVGILIALVAWLPILLHRLPLSLPIVCVGTGAAIFATFDLGFTPLPQDHPEIVEHLTEIVVIVALMGAGLKLDRAFGWKRWGITWRLLGPTMLLTIAAITLLGTTMLGLALPLALLLAASLAPTDPVLAADVQVGPPRSGEEDEARFGLTSEAGLNDGFAFPFVNLAILLAAATSTGDWLGQWLSVHVLWEIAGGIILGIVVGRLFGWITFHIPAESALAQTGDGVVALAAAFITYGLCEVAQVYGFVGVFVAALALRASHRNHDFQREMHDFTEQIERIGMMAVLILFGGALASGLLASLGWLEIGFVLLILLVVRPVAGLVSMIGFTGSRTEKATLAFFGIRGIGTFYYLAFGLNHLQALDEDRLWSIAGLIVALSILLHGVTVTPAMRLLDRRHGRDPDAIAAARQDDGESRGPAAQS